MGACGGCGGCDDLGRVDKSRLGDLRILLLLWLMVLLLGRQGIGVAVIGLVGAGIRGGVEVSHGEGRRTEGRNGVEGGEGKDGRSLASGGGRWR